MSKPSYDTLEKELAVYRKAEMIIRKFLKDPRSDATHKLIAYSTGNTFEEIKEYSNIFYQYFENTNNSEDSIIKENVVKIFKKKLKKKPKMRIVNLFFRQS